MIKQLLKALGYEGDFSNPNTQNPNQNGNNNDGNQEEQPESGNNTNPCITQTPNENPGGSTPDNTEPTQAEEQNPDEAEPTQTAGTTPNEQQPTQAAGTTPNEQQPTQAATQQGFLSANGKNLMLDGQVYKYVGINAYGLGGRETGQPYSKAEIDALFKALPPRTLIRTWAWNGSDINAMRTIVQSAEENNQMLIMSLSEGAGYDDIGVKNTDWFSSGFESVMLPWVDQIVGTFKNSKAIGMWEIMNEPGLKSDEVTDAAMQKYMSTMAARIKQNDPNHLVETGMIDCKNAKGFGDCAAINNDPNIDVMNTHDYADTYEGGATPSGNYTDAKGKIGSINKPWIIGEIGVAGGDYGGCPITGAARVARYKTKFDAYFQDGVSGINIWNWTTNPTCADEGYDFNTSDPIMNFLKTYSVPR